MTKVGPFFILVHVLGAFWYVFHHIFIPLTITSTAVAVVGIVFGIERAKGMGWAVANGGELGVGGEGGLF